MPKARITCRADCSPFPVPEWSEKIITPRDKFLFKHMVRTLAPSTSARKVSSAICLGNWKNSCTVDAPGRRCARARWNTSEPRCASAEFRVPFCFPKGPWLRCDLAEAGRRWTFTGILPSFPNSLGQNHCGRLAMLRMRCFEMLLYEGDGILLNRNAYKGHAIQSHTQNGERSTF